MKKTFKIPVIWECFGIQEVEAISLEEALEIFDRDNEDYSLPEEEYIDGSYKRHDDFETIKLFNDEQC